MFRKAFSFGGLLLLAGALILVMPGSSQAQRGGGHGGGFHGGGFQGGAHYGGYHYSNGHSFAPHYGYSYGYNYPGYGYGYSYPNYGYSYYPSTWSAPVYDSGYNGVYGYNPPSNPYAYAATTPSSTIYQPTYPATTGASLPAPAQLDDKSYIKVSVPANAEIWFDGTKTTTTGSVREYQSPPLTPGMQYTYEVQARWNENGKEVTQTQRVQVTAGGNVSVNFPVQPTKAATAPNH